jgi:hypothetical protein
MLQDGRFERLSPIDIEFFLNLSNSSCHTKPRVFTQPLTEMSTKCRKIMFLGSGALPVRRADNLTAIFEEFFKTIWDPQHLTNL